MSLIAISRETSFAEPHAIRFACLAFAAVALTLSAVPAMAGCNSGIAPNTDLLNSGNCQAYANGTGSVAVGYGARAFGSQGTTIGLYAGSPSSSAVAGATAVGAYAGSSSPGAFSTSIGAAVSGDTAPQATGSLSIAIGGGNVSSRGAQAAGTASIAIGNKSIASGSGYATALGFDSRANVGLGPTAMGTDSHAAGTNAAAFGRFAAATAGNSTALGSTSQASVTGSTALGYGARALQAGSVALGAGSVANVARTVSVGKYRSERRITNVANAISGTDAVNLRQVKALIAAQARQIAELQSELLALKSAGR